MYIKFYLKKKKKKSECGGILKIKETVALIVW